MSSVGAPLPNGINPPAAQQPYEYAAAIDIDTIGAQRSVPAGRRPRAAREIARVSNAAIIAQERLFKSDGTLRRSYAPRNLRRARDDDSTEAPPRQRMCSNARLRDKEQALPAENILPESAPPVIAPAESGETLSAFDTVFTAVNFLKISLDADKAKYDLKKLTLKHENVKLESEKAQLESEKAQLELEKAQLIHEKALLMHEKSTEAYDKARFMHENKLYKDKLTMVEEELWTSVRCPLTLEPFVRPVTICTGQTYSKESLLRFWQQRVVNGGHDGGDEPPRNRCPITNLDINHSEFGNNIVVQNVVNILHHHFPNNVQ